MIQIIFNVNNLPHYLIKTFYNRVCLESEINPTIKELLVVTKARLEELLVNSQLLNSGKRIHSIHSIRKSRKSRKSRKTHKSLKSRKSRKSKHIK